jgi:hypothetical protein
MGQRVVNKKRDSKKNIMESLKKSTMVIFWLLFLVFLVVLAEFFIPAFRNLFRGSELFLIPLATFSLLGLVLLILALKEKVEGKLKKFLLLTGASATGFFISILLHNAIYGLFIYFFGSDFWDRIGLGDEPFFFFIAIIACPIGFLVGLIGNLVLFIKKILLRKD